MGLRGRLFASAFAHRTGFHEGSGVVLGPTALTKYSCMRSPASCKGIATKTWGIQISGLNLF